MVRASCLFGWLVCCACVAPSLPPRDFVCETSNACADGFLCVGGVCRSSAGVQIIRFAPAKGFVGSLLTLTGDGLEGLRAVRIGGVPGLIVRRGPSTATVLVMPGTAGGRVELELSDGVASTDGTFSVGPAPLPSSQRRTKLDPSDRAGQSEVGSAVALDAQGSGAIINGNIDSMLRGAVWSFQRDGGLLVQQGPKVLADDTALPVAHGRSLAINADGTVVAVGAIYDAANRGAVRVFEKVASGGWVRQATLTDDAATSSLLGSSVAIDAEGRMVLSGSPAADNRAGAVWPFARTDGGWVQGPRLVAVGASGNAQFGASLALSADGTTAVVGGPGDDGGAGAAWVVVADAGAWQSSAKLTAVGSTGGARFGTSVAVTPDGHQVAVLGPGENGGAGAVWFFERVDGGAFALRGAPLSGAGIFFGAAMAMSADGARLVVTRNASTGAAHLFVRDGGSWSAADVFPAAGSPGGSTFVAAAMSLDGRVVLFGASTEDGLRGAGWAYDPN